MKEKIIVIQKDDKIYLRHVDVKKLSHQLKFAKINVYKSPDGKHTGAPRYYIDLTNCFKFIQTVKDDYSVTFL